MKNLTFSAPVPQSIQTRIIVGEDALSTLPSLLQDLSVGRIVIVHDTAVAQVAERIARMCQEHDPMLIAVQSGDASKSLTEVERIIDLMLKERCTRSITLIAVGGGMVTDLGGFIGSVFMRGIRTILVPTSTLAMVDAAIGGKTAVNAGSTKNIIGTISQPVAVVCDMNVVKELPANLFSEGLVEAVKVAAIADREFFEWLEKYVPNIIKRDTETMTECIARAIESKLRVVSEDVNDRSIRLHLNFGHTVAHALEAVSSFQISHGHAVAIGMHFEMRAVDSKEIHRVTTLLTTLGMSLDIPKKWKKKDLLWAAMQHDKKNDAGEVRIATVLSLGTDTVLTLTLERFLELL